MPMTKKHYTAIAAAIATTPMSPATRVTLIGRLQGVFIEDNPRFDRTRFTAACQPAPEAPPTPKCAAPCDTVRALRVIAGGYPEHCPLRTGESRAQRPDAACRFCGILWRDWNPSRGCGES